MKIKVALGKRKVLAGSGHDAEVLIRLLAPAASPESRRPALALVPIVDVSGSMSGKKLEAVKKALLLLLDHLTPGDHVGLVSFDSEARVVFPVTEVAQGTRAALRIAIRGLDVGGSTNLAAGLLTGVGLASDGVLPAALRKRLILLTDGQANLGVATERAELRALVSEHLGPLSLSAFGYGQDCEHSILAELAEEGRGSFAYIENHDIVLTAFARELGGLVSTYAEDVRLRLVPTAGAEVEAALGDLLYQGELTFCAPLALGRHGPSNGVEVARVIARYRDTSGRSQEVSTAVRVDYVPAGSEDQEQDPEVARAQGERLVRDAQSAAEAAAHKGDFALAHSLLAKVAEQVVHPELAAFVTAHLLPAYRSDANYAALSPLRGATAQALKKRRVLASPASVAASFDVAPNESEVVMEESFRRS